MRAGRRPRLVGQRIRKVKGGDNEGTSFRSAHRRCRPGADVIPRTGSLYREAACLCLCPFSVAPELTVVKGHEDVLGGKKLGFP